MSVSELTESEIHMIDLQPENLIAMPHLKQLKHYEL